MSHERVVNLREFPRLSRSRYLLPADVVRVDRGSPWGNPYPIPKPEKPRDRDDSIAAFRRYAEVRLRQEPDWLAPLASVRLACWCAPEPCHAEVLIDLIENGPRTAALVFGVDRMPAKEAEAAPAWPGLDVLERGRNADYDDFIRGRR